MRWFLRQTLCFLPLAAYPLVAQQLPRTTPERTNFTATSTNADVGAFLDSLQRAGAPITVSSMGVTVLGKPLYLVVASDPAVTSPAEAAASGRLVVYVQANIHGGEVEGKEAVLGLLREVAGPGPPSRAVAGAPSQPVGAAPHRPPPPNGDSSRTAILRE